MIFHSYVSLPEGISQLFGLEQWLSPWVYPNCIPKIPTELDPNWASSTRPRHFPRYRGASQSWHHHRALPLSRPPRISMWNVNHGRNKTKLNRYKLLAYVGYPYIYICIFTTSTDSCQEALKKTTLIESIWTPKPAGYWQVLPVQASKAFNNIGKASS